MLTHAATRNDRRSVAGRGPSAADPLSGMELADPLSSPLQGDGLEGRGSDVRAIAAEGVRGSGGPLPHLDAIQASFGRFDVSGIQAHTGGAAREANARLGSGAFATGDHVAMDRTDLHTAAHEAAHVVQQRAGVVQADVGSPGDRWERHAESVADAVTAGRSAEGLLAGVAGGDAPVQMSSEGPVQCLTQPPSAGGHADNSPERRDELYSDADFVAPTYYEAVTRFAEITNGTPMCPNTNGLPKLKGQDRVEEKVANEYDGDYSRIIDLVRATIVYDRIGEARHAAQLLDSGMNIRIPSGFDITWNGTFEGDFLLASARHKDRSMDMTHDHLCNVTFEADGVRHVCELQFHVRDVLDYKNEKGHDLYDIARSPESDATDRHSAMEKMSEGYAGAFGKAGGRPRLGH